MLPGMEILLAQIAKSIDIPKLVEDAAKQFGVTPEQVVSIILSWDARVKAIDEKLDILNSRLDHALSQIGVNPPPIVPETSLNPPEPMDE